jgi:hypothetical protein
MPYGRGLHHLTGTSLPVPTPYREPSTLAVALPQRSLPAFKKEKEKGKAKCRIVKSQKTLMPNGFASASAVDKFSASNNSAACSHGVKAAAPL